MGAGGRQGNGEEKNDRKRSHAIFTANQSCQIRVVPICSALAVKSTSGTSRVTRSRRHASAERTTREGMRGGASHALLDWAPHERPLSPRLPPGADRCDARLV